VNTITQREPAVSIGATVSTILLAVFAILKASGIAVTDEMTDGITALILALCSIPAVAGVLTRFFVYSPASVEKIATTQYQAGTPPTEPQPDVPPPAKV
jgi:hypothetical protein